MAAMLSLANRLVSGSAARYLSNVPALILVKYFLHERRLGRINMLVPLIMMLAAGAVTRPGVSQGLVAGARVGVGPHAESTRDRLGLPAKLGDQQMYVSVRAGRVALARLRRPPGAGAARTGAPAGARSVVGTRSPAIIRPAARVASSRDRAA
jgi:hypothetical protein